MRLRDRAVILDMVDRGREFKDEQANVVSYDDVDGFLLNGSTDVAIEWYDECTLVTTKKWRWVCEEERGSGIYGVTYNHYADQEEFDSRHQDDSTSKWVLIQKIEETLEEL